MSYNTHTMSLVFNVIYDDTNITSAGPFAELVGQCVLSMYKRACSWSEHYAYRAYFAGVIDSKSAISMYFPHIEASVDILASIQQWLCNDGVASDVTAYFHDNGFSETPFLCEPSDTMTTFVYNPAIADLLDTTMGMYSQERVTYSICRKLYSVYKPCMTPSIPTAVVTQPADGTDINVTYVTTMLDLCVTIQDSGIAISDEHMAMIYAALADYSYQVFSYDKTVATYASTAQSAVFKSYFKPVGVEVSLMEVESILKMYSASLYAAYKSMYVLKLIKHQQDTVSLDVLSVARLCSAVLRLMYMTEYMASPKTNQLYCFTQCGWYRCEGTSKLHTSVCAMSIAIDEYASTAMLDQVGLSHASYDDFKLKLYRFLSVSTRVNSIVHRLMSDLVLPSYSKRKYVYTKCVAFNNGVYDLRQKVFRPVYPHDIGYYRTQYDYYVLGTDIELEHQLDMFMSSIFPCDEVKEYVYIMFSRCFEGVNLDKGIWFFIGNTNAGKSRFMDFIATTFGEYSSRLHAKMFNEGGRYSGQATTSLNQTIGKLVGVIQEPPRTNYNVETIKEYTGETTLSCRMLFKEADQIQNTIRYFCCANATNISTSDAAFWRRLSVVPFVVQFLPDEEYANKVAELRERYYCDNYNRTFDTLEKEVRLYAREDPAISSKLTQLAPVLMSVLIRYYTDHDKRSCNLRSFKSIVVATAKFRLSNDTVFRFVRCRTHIARCAADVNTMQESMSYVYDAFATWYDANTHGKRVAMNTEELASALSGMGLEIHGEGSEQVVRGLTLRPEVVSSLSMYHASSNPAHNITVDEQKAALGVNEEPAEQAAADALAL